VATIAGLAAGLGISTADLAVRAGVSLGELPQAFETNQVVRFGEKVFAAQAIAVARKSVLDSVAAFHQSHPLEPGISREQLRQQIESPELADLVERQLAKEGALVLETGTARLPQFSATLDGTRTAEGAALEKALLEAGAEGRTVAELAPQLPSNRALDLAEFLVRKGTAIRVGKDRYYNRGELEKLVQKVLAKLVREGEVTPAQLRESLGLTRKYLIPLLEWLDAQGLTVRVGDARRLGAAAHPMLKELGKES
jgi:selenocysteine-specific elongation factor